MNRIRNLALAASAIIPAVAMFGGTAFAGGDAAPAVQYKDLVVNGKFNTNVSGWTPGEYASISWKESHGYVYNTVPVAGVTSTHEVTQCVEIEPNSRPTFRGSIFIPEGQVRTGSASFKLTYFKNENCTNFKGNSQVPALVNTGQWRHTEFQLDPMTAKDAKSVLIAMQVTKDHTKPLNRGKKFVAVFDNIKLLQKIDPIQPDDDKHECEHICIDPDDAPPPPAPPAVEPDDTDDQPAIDEPADLPGDEDQQAEDPETPAVPQPGDSGDSDDSADDAPSAGGSETPANPGAGGSNQPGTGTGNNPSTNGGAPAPNNQVEAPANGDGKATGGETGKPNTNANGGSASKTPLAPETGSTAQAEDDSTSAALFGAVTGTMAGLGLLFAIILKRRANRRDA